jgi:L-seryl-tRNA(Ser) seleniumtransferase
LAVNNNAAALLLTASVLANGKEAVISRGELLEIGDSFRLADIISQGGAIIREVGATNRTRLSDYRKAICPERTGLIFKVHKSNFQQLGYDLTISLKNATF